MVIDEKIYDAVEASRVLKQAEIKEKPKAKVNLLKVD